MQIDETLCVGFGDCIEAAPELFEFDDDGVARFVDDAPETGRERVIAACDICPVDALVVLDETGTQIVP